MALRVKALVISPDDLRSLSKTYVVGAATTSCPLIYHTHTQMRGRSSFNYLITALGVRLWGETESGFCPT